MRFKILKQLLPVGNTRSVNLKKNVFASVLLKGISILVSLALIPATIDYVTSELYGVWLTISSILSFLSFFDIGLSNGLKNKLTESIANNDWKRGKELVSTTYISMTVVFLPLTIIASFVIPFIDWTKLLNVNSIYENDIVIVMEILVAFFCMQIVVNVLTSVISAFQKVALSQLFGVLGNILSLLLILFIKHIAPASLELLSFIMVGPTLLITIIASLILYTNRFRNVAPNIHYFNKSMLGDLFSLGIKFFIIQIQFIIIYQSTNILISHVSSPENVTAYNIAYRYLSIAMIIFNIFTAPLWPAYTDAFTKKDFVWMHAIRKKMHILLLICCVGCILMAVVSPWVYDLWIGNQVYVPALMTWLVAIYVIVYGLTQVNATVISASGKMQLSTIVTCIGMLVYIPLALLLSNYWCQYGILMAMIIINILYAFIYATQSRMLISGNALGIWSK